MTLTKAQREKIFSEQIKDFAMIIVFLFTIFLLGLLMNITVKMSNDWKMPVFNSNIYSSFETEKHFSYSDKNEISFWYFSDIIEFKTKIASIGDIFIFAGVGFVMMTTFFMVLCFVRFKFIRKKF